MRRLLLAAAVAASAFTFSPAANACAFRQCAWGVIVCSTVNCPHYCVQVTQTSRVCVIA